MKNKKLLIGGISLALIGLGSLSLISKPTYQVIDNNNLDTEKIAVYIKNENGNYEKSNTIPTSGYTLNTSKSTCNNGTTPSWNKSNNSLKLNNLSGSTSCYLYFDEQELTESEQTLSKLDITNYSTETPDFSQAATTDEGIFKVEDGMYGGYSYYWRGAATTNYVRFANKCWRIIRINGDGTIRLIYDGTTCHENGTSTADSIAVTTQAYYPSYDRSEYVGYTFTQGSQRGTNTASNLKNQTESWFNNNSNFTASQREQVVDGYFCNDRNTASGSSWSSQPSSTFYYAARERLQTNKVPTLACANASDKYTLKIGAITADEVSFAGDVYNTANQSYYLYNGQYYWTMSPLFWEGSSRETRVFTVYSDGQLLNHTVNSTTPGTRPVINIRSDVTFVSGGEGTINNPYVVEGAE